MSGQAWAEDDGLVPIILKECVGKWKGLIWTNAQDSSIFGGGIGLEGYIDKDGNVDLKYKDGYSCPGAIKGHLYDSNLFKDKRIDESYKYKNIFFIKGEATRDLGILWSKCKKVRFSAICDLTIDILPAEALQKVIKEKHGKELTEKELRKIQKYYGIDGDWNTYAGPKGKTSSNDESGYLYLWKQ
jgi:hypothetical protein